MIIFPDLSYSAFLIKQWTPPSPNSIEKQSFGNKAINSRTFLIPAIMNFQPWKVKRHFIQTGQHIYKILNWSSGKTIIYPDPLLTKS